VYTVFDYDTGLIGFVHVANGKKTEYSFNEAPVEYKIAFTDIIAAVDSSSLTMNLKICRKSKLGKHLLNFTD